MLKALELCGFKSFADRTRFEFPPGITIVVGPNGSGKSNIVDAIKWVLGEQSAKSLRGREMADVIFKGSGGASPGRRPANTAEVTIVFDNADGVLPVDTPEVRVTRRVYRSGEGEYAINSNPCRLRDVKDLFRGTGMGADAYSLIEQGKVDTLLQALPRDRRAIFEEAAGISRFKAKKVETQRRLERVELNLQRLCDIVEEVESQLRAVRNQASKARRYKEYTDRLKELRTHVGLADWRRFSQELARLDAERAQVVAQAAQLHEAVSSAETRTHSIDQQLMQLDVLLHEAESLSGQVREDLAGNQSTVHHEYQHLDELAHEIQRYRRQWRAMTARAGDLGVQLQQLHQQVSQAQQEDEAIRQRLLQQQAALGSIDRDLDACRRLRDEQRDEHEHKLRISGDLSRRIGVLESELQSLQQQLERGHQQLTVLDAQSDQSRSQHIQAQAVEQAAETVEQSVRAALNQARAKLQGQERQLNEQQQRAVDLQRRLAVATERANVLQDLQRRHEGLSPGVKQMLLKAQESPLGPLASIRGMVAELIRVDVRMAPLIDAALGDLTQYLVVEGSSLAQELANGDLPLQGRVGVIDLQAVSPQPSDPHQLASDRNVLGRADRFVDSDPKYVELMRSLLGSTWCVESLRDALRLRALVPQKVRFVTRAGELLEADGRLLAGPRQATLGLVTRRSELRSLQLEILELEPQLQKTEERVAGLKSDITSCKQDVDLLTSRYDDAADTLMNARLATRSAAERVATLQQQRADVTSQLQRQSSLCDEVSQQRQQQQKSLEDVHDLVGKLEQDLAEQQRAWVELDARRQRELSRLTEVKVELAKSEQRVDSLRGQLVRFQEDQRERERALDETRSHLQTAESRHLQTERTILQATSALAELFLQAEQQQIRIGQISRDRNRLLDERNESQHELNDIRGRLQRFDELRHGLDLDISRLQLERESLAERVRDDYEIELAAVGDSLIDGEQQPQDREEIDREIHELRRRLSNIGAVNMAALEEIEMLEQRHAGLAAQYQDLVAAKDSLARIIQKINADSRRLFTESLEAIRTNFQAIFRRVFGGGNADIVLEEGVDILDAGIDILATPPGKHSLGISLLSGGERALTAVTLLLAIFQYRPSPFCVLDEVDGPLDEANIGRFVDVLNEFLQWTKFVVVTHSKKTMTAAHTLYGVTMQESGVSKRVSVQFEDVSEDGQIREEAISRETPPPTTHAPSGDDDERGAA
jgi:chromosome segregation protein